MDDQFLVAKNKSSKLQWSQYSNHLNAGHLNTGWVSSIQMVKSHDLADHLNTGHVGP